VKVEKQVDVLFIEVLLNNYFIKKLFIGCE